MAKPKLRVDVLGWWQNTMNNAVCVHPADRIELRYCTSCHRRWIIINGIKRVKDGKCDICAPC